MMKKQYKEYKTLDKDISDLIIYDDNMFLSPENEIEFIEDIDDLNLLELKKYIIEKIDIGDFINLLEKLCRNRLMKIIPMLVLDEKEYEIYSLFYKNRETQSEIGKKIGVTRQSISKILKKINGKFDYASQNITNHYHEQVM